MCITIRPIASPAEYQAVCQLRYQVYINERQVDEKYADHDRRVIEEPLDKRGVVLAAFEHGRVVGSIRMNVGHDPHIDDYADFYDIDGIGGRDRGTKAIVTKLMVDQDHRRSMLGIRLVQEAYQRFLEMGVRFVFIDANENLIKLYERLGFVTHREDAVHPVYGLVRRMVIDLHDEAHFEAVRSPFLALYRAWRRACESQVVGSPARRIAA